MHRSVAVLFCCLAAAVLPGAVRAGQWGDLKIRFVYDGPPPVQLPATITSDRDFCCQHTVLQETLVVNPQTRGIANVIVYLYLGRTDPQPPVHDSYKATEAAEVSLDNANCRFDPHVVLLRTTQTLRIGNKDPIGHNTKIDTFANPPINPIIPANGVLRQQFPQGERLPCRVSCNIHPWMSAWIVVKENPYFGVSDPEGVLLIRNLPVGKWTFQVWHEKAGYVSDVKLGGQSVAWSRGRVEVEIKPGLNELGDAVLAPAMFEK